MPALLGPVCVCVLAPALLCVFGGVLVWRLRLPLVARAAAPGLAAAPDVYFNTSKRMLEIDY